MRRTYVGFKLAKSASLVFALLALFAPFTLTSCETAEDNAISKSRNCLDSADSSSAAACTQGLDGIDNPNAWLMRCSADFIAQGFDGTAMANAFTQLSNASGNTTTAMMSFLVFTSQSSADKAAGDCSKALQPSMALLGSFAQTATILANACQSSCTSSRTGGFDSTGFATGITQLHNSDVPATDAAIGNAVLTAYDQQCSIDANKTSSICAQVISAIGGSADPTTIGRALITNLFNTL